MREKDKRENKNGKRRGRGKKKEGGKEGRENLGDCCLVQSREGYRSLFLEGGLSVPSETTMSSSFSILLRWFNAR